MSRGSLSVDVTRKHLTRAERTARARREKGMLTGTPMREYAATRADKAAHATWVRVKRLMREIGHDDAIHEAVINRYCTITSECADLEQDRREIETACDELDMKTRYEMKDRLDRALISKRKMLLDIERDCAMTVKGALAAVPKAGATDEETLAEMDDPMRALMRGEMEK